MTTSLSAAELANLVTAVPGVRGIEPGIGSTLRAIGSHIRQQDPRQARFGVVVEAGSRRAVIEIGIDGSRPVREIVHDVQETIIRSLSEAGEPTTPPRHARTTAPPASGAGALPRSQCGCSPCCRHPIRSDSPPSCRSQHEPTSGHRWLTGGPTSDMG